MIPVVKRWFHDHDCDPGEATERNWHDDFDLLAMDVEGNLFTLFADTLHRLSMDYFAIGSGMPTALGAMAAGADAAEAIRISTLFDSNTGLPVQSISADQLKKILKTNARRR